MAPPGTHSMSAAASSTRWGVQELTPDHLSLRAGQPRYRSAAVPSLFLAERIVVRAAGTGDRGSCCYREGEHGRAGGHQGHDTGEPSTSARDPSPAKLHTVLELAGGHGSADAGGHRR